MELRPDTARLSDLAALAALERASFTHPDYADAIVKARQYRRFLQSPSAEVLVLRAGDGTIKASAIVLYRKGCAHARLYSLAVDPALQGRGAGTRLMHYAEERVRARGISRIRLEMRESDEKLKSFYTKMNYEVIKWAPCYYNASAAALILQKTLPPNETMTAQGGGP